MKKFRVGIIVDLLLEGGVQKAAIEQVKELNKLGHTAKLLILIRKKYPTDYSYLTKEVPYQYLSDSYPFIFKKSIKFPIFNFLSFSHLISPLFVPKIIKKGDYDVVIAWGSTTCLTASTLFKFNEIPYLAIIHDPFVYILRKVYSKSLLKYLFPIIIPVAEMIEGILVRNSMKTILISKVHYGYIKMKYHNEPAIVSLGISLQKKISSLRGNNLLSFGRWQKEKNPQFILKIAKEFPKEKFIIAGSWIKESEYQWFKTLIKKEGLEKRIKLIPHFDDHQLREMCRKARLWLYPHFEAFGLAALEAAGHGLPIIIPAHSGITESFKTGVHGFFPKDVNINEYKKYISLLISDKKMASEMGMRAREVVKNKFSWSSKVQEVIKLIERGS